MGVLDDAEDQEPPFHGGDIETRMGLLERDSRSHARTLTQITTHYGGLEHRVNELADWKMNEMLAAAREEERDKALMDRLNRIDNNISDLKAGPNRLVWLVLSNAMPAIIFGIAWVIVRAGA